MAVSFAETPRLDLRPEYESVVANEVRGDTTTIGLTLTPKQAPSSLIGYLHQNDFHMCGRLYSFRKRPRHIQVAARFALSARNRSRLIAIA
jgi:hypothetical protein